MHLLFGGGRRRGEEVSSVSICNSKSTMVGASARERNRRAPRGSTLRPSPQHPPAPPRRASSPSPPSPTAAPAQRRSPRRGAAARHGAACASASRTHGTGGSARQLSARGGAAPPAAPRSPGRSGEGGRGAARPGPPAPGPAAVRALRGRGAACRAAGRSLPLLCGGAAPCACGGAASRTQAAQGWPRNASGLGTGRSRAAMAPRLLLPPCCFSRFLRRRRRRASERDTGFENAARHPRDVPPPTRG